MKLIKKINIFFLTMGFAFVLSACGEKMVSVPSNADNYTGLYFQAVIDELKKAGFSDINLTVLEDLSSYGDLADGAVESVTINDSASFVAKEKFSPESKVVITYHIIPKCSPAIPADKLQNYTYDEIGRAFTDAGFTDVSITDVYDLDPDEVEAEFINEVSIGGITSFKSNDEMPFDTPVVVTCHYPYEKYTVKLTIDFIPNLIFSKYDVDLSVNGEKEYTLSHGIDAEYEFRIREGNATFTFSNADSPSVKGEITLLVNCDIDAAYKISCYSDKVSVDELFVDYKNVLMDDETKVMDSKWEFIGKNYRDVVATLEGLGFTNIKTVPEYDIIWGITETESIDSISIAGRTDFKRGSVLKKDAEIIIVYHMPYDQEPGRETTKPTSNNSSVSTAIPEESANNDVSPEATETNAVSYSTNDLETAKKGNSGVFSYKNRGGSYDIYYIIDFDEGYVYYFLDGNDDASCDRVKIDSGDLNSVLSITYHDGSDTWSYGLHFKWKNQPDHLVLEDNDHFEYDFYTTNLNDALAIRNGRKIIDY